VNPATMTPEQLAEHGVPVIVALRSRLEEAEAAAHELELEPSEAWVAAASAAATYRDALAILEAKGER
jgi:hypothetical protein